MAHPSLQVCMDSSDWLQGTMSEDISSGLDSSSSPSGATDCMLAAACSSRAGPPLMERRLRPPHDQNLKCPRCESTHTKFCYYNNYSLSQPRYFCKTCRRYWTKGGTLRNIPVGGGCRKNKKSTSKKSNDSGSHHHQPLAQGGNGGGSAALGPPSTNPMDLHLAFPEVQFPSHLANLIGAQMSLGGGSFMENNLIRPIDFMESKYGQDFLGNNSNNSGGDHQFGIMGGYNGISSSGNSFSGICSSSPFGVSNGDHNLHHDGTSGIGFVDQRLLLPYDGNNDHHHHQGGMDVKPNPKLLSLEWQDQGCSNANSDVVAAKDSTTSFGYNVVVNGALGSWSGMMGGFQPSTTNSLV